MTRDIPTAGTLARLVGGGLLLAGAWVVDLSWWDVGAAVVLYPLLAVAGAAVAARQVPALRRHLGDQRREGSPARSWSAAAAWTSVGVGAFVLVTGTVLTFLTPLDGGSLYLFFGGSMVLAAVMGYGGCEVLALPNLLLGRRDEVWCLLYSPLDRAVDPREHSHPADEPGRG